LLVVHLDPHQRGLALAAVYLGKSRMVGVLFLELNGYRFMASEEAAAQAVLELAAGTMDERGFCKFVRANSKWT
jgi:prophage maintenance system killer protein